MQKYRFETIIAEEQGPTGTILLNRPAIHNAFDGIMLEEITICIQEMNNRKHLRSILLKGNGNSFCAGADIKWMHSFENLGFQKNNKNALILVKCLDTIYNSRKPVIGIGHGKIFGGGIGLLAACDFTYAVRQATFSFKETRLGIVPACISPYIIKRIGEFKAREFMLTGNIFSADEAEKAGLINKSLDKKEVGQHIRSIISDICNGGPEAISKTKNIIIESVNKFSQPSFFKKTAKTLALAKISEEGKEGINAFLEKRKPRWIMSSSDTL